jgi:uncharacterized protein (TIGR03437 family)
VTQQQKQFPTPDVWIGQSTLSSRVINFTGTATPSPQGLFLTNGTTILQSSLALDSSGNLYVTDAGNLRVLRFKAADLATGGGGLIADLVLGQNNFVTDQTPLNNGVATSRQITNQFFLPDALGFDSNGNLFVTDFIPNTSANSVARVLVFSPPFSSGMSASRMAGIFPPNFVPPTDPNAVQALLDSTVFQNPGGIFLLTGSTPGVGVVDSGSHRILIFDTYANWPTDGTPPKAKFIFGQSNSCSALQPGLPASALCRVANNGNPRPASSTLSNPQGVFASSTDLFVVDSGNNRVLDLPISAGTLSSATRVLGQDRMDTNSANLIEGREFQFIDSLGFDAGIAIDSTTSTPHLYVADPGNNRVLGFKDLRNLKPGARADIVIGQPDLQTALVNYPTNDATKPNQSGLYRPVGLALDPQGNLYVADSLNGRVLRFPAPFASGAPTALEQADLVLGQQNFTSKIPDATNSTMLGPYGLAFSGVNGLVVSDQGLNRVLYFPMTNGTFAAGNDNGKSATLVFGQQGFNSSATGTDLTSMNSPHGVSTDSSGFIYVADTNNNRVLIFNDPHASGSQSGEAASFAITGMNAPQGVFVSQLTGEIWVANSNAGTLLRYANYNSVLLNTTPFSSITDAGSYNGGFIGLAPLAVAEDQYGALYVADSAHRVAFYYPGLNACNGATFMATSPAKAPNLCAPFDTSANTLNAHPLAPLALGTIFPCANCAGDQFGDAIASFNGTYPVPIVMNDVQVTVDGVPAPLYYVGGPIPPGHPTGQINFIVPNGARTVGNADVEVIRVSTGQVLGATLVPMAAVSPGILVCANYTGTYRNACVLNQDNTANGPNNPAARGTYISIYATGQGNVPAAPADGVSPSGPIPSSQPLTVLINATDVNNAGEAGQHIGYSGLDGFPGIWQINVLIPQTITPASQETQFNNSNPLNIIVNGVANTDTGLGWKTVIWVK